jgi:hypothetical protein
VILASISLSDMAWGVFIVLLADYLAQRRGR